MTARQARRHFLRYRATGDPEALGRVFDLTASRLLLLALHLVRDGEQAEDLVQTTFLHAIQAAGTYDPKRPLLPWLVGILTHRAKDLQRRQSLRRGAQEAGEPLDDTADRRPGPCQAAQNSETLRHVAQALDAVPGQYRQVLVLHLVHDLRPIQIAHALERSPEAVRTQLHRGREMLRKALPRGLALPVAIAAALPGTGLAAARVKVLAAAKVAMPASTTATAAAAVTATVGKTTWLGITAVSLGLVASLLWLGWFSRDRGDPDPLEGGRRDVAAAVDDPKSVPADHAASPTERTEIPKPEATGHGQLVLAVTDEVGRPIQATVWRWQEDSSEAMSKATDAGGVVRFVAAADHPGALIASAPGRPLHVQQLARLAGQHRIQLSPGRRLQGWLVVDGKTPAEPVGLRVHSRSKTLAFLPPSLRQEILGERLQSFGHTKPDGWFEVGGLPEDWSGSIELPENFWLSGADLERAIQGNSSWRHCQLSAPGSGLRLEATQLPTVLGQVVWADTGEAVPDAKIMAMVYLADGHNTPAMGLCVDGEGRFRFGVYPGATSRLRDWANHPERRSAMAMISLRVAHDEAITSRLVFDPKELASPGDVGTIPLERTARLWCQVVDTAGKPIEGALVEGRSVSHPTDAEGRTIVSVADSGQRRFLAGALGYVVDEVEAQDGSGTAQHPLRLQLPPGNFLRIQVQDPHGKPPTRFLVTVKTQGPLFTGPKRGHITPVHQRLGTPFDSYDNPFKLTEMCYRYSLHDSPRGKGEILLASLIAGARLEVRVLDRLRQEVSVRYVDGIGAGATTLAIRLPKQPICLAGQILDTHGNPLPGARVRAFLDGRDREAQASADRQGRFLVPSLYPTQARLRVVASCRGHTSAVLENVILHPDMAPLELRLAEGREVRVEFVTTNGDRVEVGSCRVDVETPCSDRLQPGVFRFTGLPARVVTFSTTIAGQEHRLAHDTAQASARFVLPPMGCLVVEAAASLRPKDVTFLRARVLRVPSGEVVVEEWLRGADALPVLRTDRLLLPAGRYTVEVGHYQAAGNGGQERVFRTVTGSRPVTVATGGPSRCRF